jgi:hypothetical protein
LAPRFSDVATGVYAFQAIATALFARATVGMGRWIDVSLTQSMAAAWPQGRRTCSGGGAPRALNVPAGSYETRDGWLMVTLVNESQYKRLCTAIEREDLASDPRFLDCADSADALIPQLREVFLTQSSNLAYQTSCVGHYRRANPQSRRLAALCSRRGNEISGLPEYARRWISIRAAHAGLHETFRGQIAACAGCRRG